MKKSRIKSTMPDLTEFTDEEGKKWIQTSTEDLFSIQELNDILESVEKKEDGEEIVLARINFQKVNKEYYDTAIALQKKLTEKNELLKKVVKGSRETIERKNKKLKELIEYIKKLHILIAHLNADESEIQKLEIPSDLLLQQTQTSGMTRAEYEEVEEIILSTDKSADEQLA